MGVFNFLNKGIRGFLGREMGGGSRGITQQRLQTQAGKSGGGHGVLGGGGSGAGFKGNRGIRAVSIEQPNLTEQIPGLPAPYAERVAGSLLTPEGIEVPATEMNEFLYGHAKLVVSSSNLASATFFPESNIMHFEFLSGAVYAVSPITQDEAMDFAQSASKGGWYWSHVRVRGSKTRHQKIVALLSGGARHEGRAQGPYGGANPLGH